MKIANDTLVSIEFILTDGTGGVLDQSTGQGPLSYVHGHGNMVPGLEKALLGKRVGDKVSVSIPPEDGYGAYDDALIFEVPRSELPPGLQPQKGMVLPASGPDGEPEPITILEVKGNRVVMDRNHPFAGKTLHFEVEVVQVRKATRQDFVSDCCASGTCTDTPEKS